MVFVEMKSILKSLWESSLVFAIRRWFFNLSEILTDYRDEKKRFLEKTGYPLDIKQPKSFNHHLVWKKIYDRNPVLPILCDKYYMRAYIEEKLGKERAEKILVPLLWVGDDPEEIPFDRLGGEYIIKANHNSGPNFIIENGSVPDKEKIIKDLKEQLKHPYGVFKHEWAYGQIKKRVVIIERLLRDEQGKLPKDYKFHMVKGQCAFIQIDFDRFTDHSRSLYDKNWNFIKGALKFKQGPEDLKPKNFNDMLSLAEELSGGFDYIRIDLYNIDGQIYLGEMTHYPGSGMEKFTPISLDFEFGKYWEK